MKILILYGTTEGQTRKICEFIAKELTAMGDAVSLVDAVGDLSQIDLREFNGAIVAASLHAGQYQSGVRHFVSANKSWLNQMPSAFVSVSLSAASSDPEELQGIATCAKKFRDETGWHTEDVTHVAGAFRFTEYDYFKRWLMKLIAWEKGVKIEPGKDLELTNWRALSEAIDAIRARFSGRNRKGTSP